MTFKLLGYLIGFEKRSVNNKRNGSKPVCKIVSDGRFFYLTTPEGQRLPQQLTCTIIERVNELPKARVELYVDLSDILIEPRGCRDH